MFTEKTHALKEMETLQAQNSRLESIVAEACRIVPELHIPKDAQLEAKIKKLIAGVREANTEVGGVQFELNMKTTNLQLKLQPTTPPEVREQHGSTIKEGMATLDTVVADCLVVFD